MGKKYIVEIGRLERLYKASADAYGKPNITWLSPEIDLTPYTEPDLEQVRKDAYADGYNTGFKRKIDVSFDALYQEGLSDAWEAVKKLARMDTDTSESITGYFGLHNIMHNLTASEAIEKIRQYEQEEDRQARIEFNCEEIKDVLNTTVKECNVSLDEIAAVLEKMRGEQDG